MQIKKGGTVLLQRQSKTSLMGQSGRIVDPIKYKFKNVTTDEQQIVKLLLNGS